MMRKQLIEGKNQFAMLTVDDFMPKDHLARKIDTTIQFPYGTMLKERSKKWRTDE